MNNIYDIESYLNPEKRTKVTNNIDEKVEGYMSPKVIIEIFYRIADLLDSEYYEVPDCVKSMACFEILTFLVARENDQLYQTAKDSVSEWLSRFDDLCDIKHQRIKENFNGK